MPVRKRKKPFIKKSIFFLVLLVGIVSFLTYKFPQVKTFVYDQLGITKHVLGSACHLSGDIMLITDVSDSMKGQKLQDAINAAKSFVDIVASNNSPVASDRIGLVTFAPTAKLNSPLTTNYSSVKSALDSIGGTALGTCMGCGVDTASQEIQINGRPNITKVGIILTDGKANWVQGWPPGHPLDANAGEAAANTSVDTAYGNNGMIFYTVGLGQGVNQNFLQSISDRTGGIYYFSPGLGQLQAIYQNIAESCPTGPTPPPSGTPYPTLTPPPNRPNSISGNVYIDYVNTGNYTIPPDKLYDQGTSIIDIYDNKNNPVDEQTTNTGQYTTKSLTPGNYLVRYTSLPSGYFMTFPRNGPPPSFSVTVGNNCNPGNDNDGYCVSGSAKNVNFGITNIKPWYQSFCGDLRIDGTSINNGVQSTGVTDPIPLNPTCGSGASPAPYVIASTNTCTNTAGIVFSGNNSYDFGNGTASQNNYIAGGNSLYPEVYTPTNKDIIRTSYSYMVTTAKQSGITPIELDDGTSGRICTLSNCILPNTLKHGLYHASGDLYLNSFDVPRNNDFVILVKGNVYLNGSVIMPASYNSTFTLSASGSIYITPAVGQTDPTDTTGSIAGLYSADKSFILQSNGLSCAAGNNDKRFNVEGGIIVNAGLKNPAGTFENERNLCINNFSCPTVGFITRPDLLLKAPVFIKHTTSLFQELAP